MNLQNNGCVLFPQCNDWLFSAYKGRPFISFSRSFNPLFPHSFHPVPFTVVYASVAGTKEDQNQLFITGFPRNFERTGKTKGSNQALLVPTIVFRQSGNQTVSKGNKSTASKNQMELLTYHTSNPDLPSELQS